MKTINILICEDHQFVAEGLKDLIEQEVSYKVVAIAKNGREAYSYVKLYLPDVLITDLNMPDIDGLELLDKVKVTYPKMKVLVLSMYKNMAIVTKAMEKNIDGYLLKEDNGQEILEAIKLVLDGNKYFSSGLNLKPKNRTLFKDSFVDKYNLTERELEILEMIALSNSSKNIAEKLNISILTVQTHRRNLKKKLFAQDTADLVRFALKNGIIKSG
jgi:DNA-binding NarL/FixJ family response regulator